MTLKMYKQYVLETAHDLCQVRKKSIYTYSYYFDAFLTVLKHVNSLRSLSVTTNFSGKSKYHYTTIRKMFNKWSKLKVFQIAYDKMLIVYKNNLPHSKSIDLFIDACFISNKTGS